MKLERWRAKRLLMAPFSLSGAAEDLYEWLTAVLLGTQRGMSRKWCYWFREHVVLCRRYGRTDFGDSRLWLFEPGWSLAPVLLGRMISSREILVTESRARLAGRYLAPAREEVESAAPAILRSAGLRNGGDPPGAGWSEAASPRRVLSECRARYVVGGLDSLGELPTGSADVCFSMGRLEHFSREDLERLTGQMFRILRPGGVASHIVDHRDHHWHFDKSIHCFHHLCFSDEEWASLARGRHLYRNRLLEEDYIRLFERRGFEVRAAIHRLHREDASGVDPSSLWGRYSALTPRDLEAAVTHFVVRRP